MCDVEKAQRIFDQWLIPVKNIKVVKKIDCEDGCDDRQCSNPGDHPDHDMEVTIDIPTCFSACTGLSECDCWYYFWEDLGWFGTEAPTVATDLRALELVHGGELTEDSLLRISYESMVCPPNPLKGNSRYDLAV